MTSGCTLQETFATVVARRNTTPVEGRGPKELNTMVMRFRVHREAKVDVVDYMRTSRARVQRLYQLSTHSDEICVGERIRTAAALLLSCTEQRSWNHEMRRSDRRARQFKCTNRIAVRADCEHACNITHVACLFCWALIAKDSGPTAACGLHLADHKRKSTCREKPLPDTEILK
jgi:hypothetical protein